MKKGSAWRANFKRALFSPVFYAAAAGITLILLMEALFVVKKGGDAWNLYGNAYAGTGVSIIIYIILPVFPFSLIYAGDQEQGAVTFWSVRCGIRRYMRSMFWTAVLSGFATVFLGCFCFGSIVFSAFPFDKAVEEAANYDSGHMFGVLLNQGKKGFFLLWDSIYKGLSGAVIAGTAICFSSFVPNRLAAAAAPAVAYVFLLRIFNNVPNEISIANLLGYGVQIAWESSISWIWSFLYKFVWAMIVCILLGICSEINAQRRQKNV